MQRRTATTKKLLMRAMFVLFLTLALAVSSVFAIVLFSSHVFGEANLGTGDLPNNDVTVNIGVREESISFAAAGDKKDIPLSVTNNAANGVTDKCLNYYYGLTCDGLAGDSAAALAAAVFVYYDGEYIGTLSGLCSDGEYVTEQGVVFPKATAADTLTFELHIGAPEALYSGKSLSVTVTSYTQTADYFDYIYVTSEVEFLAAVNDINSGLLAETVTVVLGNNLTLAQEYTLSNPCVIDLHGNALSFGDGWLNLMQNGTVTLRSSVPPKSAPTVTAGKIQLNGENALLNIEDFSASADYAKMVTAVRYDRDGAEALLAERITGNLKSGIRSGDTVNVYASLSFYAESASVISGESSLNAGMVLANTTERTLITTLTVNGRAYEFKIIGNAADDILAFVLNELRHIPNITDDSLSVPVTGNLFLPKSIEEKNVTILWTSGNESIMDANGRLADGTYEDVSVTLYAQIRVNDVIIGTQSFTFKVSSQNNAQKFFYLITQLSPVTLRHVYEGDNKDRAYVYLPVVGGTYDYRNSFGSIPNAWTGFDDIGLESISYTVTNAYNYISLDNAGGNCAVYLNSPVFYTFAQVQVSGKFQRDDTVYTGTLNVIISLGDNTDLNELVFNYVGSELTKIDILQNILDTRTGITDYLPQSGQSPSTTENIGMANERGDFYLPDSYMNYSIKYAVPTASQGIITAIEHDEENGRYLFRINAEGFSSVESNVGVTVQIKESTSGMETNRILYFDTPAIIKPDSDGFANISVFNSAKYQVFSQLPAQEQRGDTGFELSGGAVSNKTGAYILQYDAERCTSLKFYVEDDQTALGYSNEKVYHFMRLLEWATGKTTASAESVVSGCGATTADGKEYLNDSEIAVLKAYWQRVTGSAMSDELWNSVSERAPGKVISNGAGLNGEMSAIVNEFINDNIPWFYPEQTYDFIYFKYTEVMQWAANEKDFAAGFNNKGCAPNMEIISNNDKNSIFNDPQQYGEDETEYITEQEEAVLVQFWENVSTDDRKFGERFKSMFDACTLVPTYLISGGVQTLGAELYKALGISIGWDSVESSNGAFTVRMKDGVPLVTNMDNTTAGIDYFSNLTALEIYGNDTLSAFLNTAALNGAFSRITSRNEKIEKLAMSYCANNYVAFDLTNTARLKNLTYIDYSHNGGISNVGVLVNANMSNYQYLDLHGVNVEYKYAEYTLANVYTASGRAAAIWYTSELDGNKTQYAPDTLNVKAVLTYLKEIGSINSIFLQLPDFVYDDIANTVYWYIEEGNGMQEVDTAANIFYGTENASYNDPDVWYYYANPQYGGAPIPKVEDADCSDDTVTLTYSGNTVGRDGNDIWGMQLFYTPSSVKTAGTRTYYVTCDVTSSTSGSITLWRDETLQFALTANQTRRIEYTFTYNPNTTIDEEKPFFSLQCGVINGDVVYNIEAATVTVSNLTFADITDSTWTEVKSDDTPIAMSYGADFYSRTTNENWNNVKDKWYYFDNREKWAGDNYPPTTVAEATFSGNKASVTYSGNTSTAGIWCMQLFYTPSSVKTAEARTYSVSCTITSSVSGSITLWRHTNLQFALTAGEALPIKYTFTYNPNDAADEKQPFFSLQCGVMNGGVASNIEAATITVENLTFAATDDPATAAPVIEDPATAAPASATTIRTNPLTFGDERVTYNEANRDKWYYWNAYEVWESGNPIVNVADNHMFFNNTATLTYSNNISGTDIWGMQLFYTPSNVTSGHTYRVRCTVTSSVTGSVTLHRDANLQFALTENVARTIEYTFTYNPNTDSTQTLPFFSLQCGIENNGVATNIAAATISVANLAFTDITDIQTTRVEFAVATNTMYNILAEANRHLHDAQFGNYYGMYYYYTGKNATTVDRAYETNGVYRLMIDEDGKFFFQHELGVRSTCTTVNDIQTLQTLALNATAADVGKVYYYTGIDTADGDERTYEKELFYEMSYNEVTGTYYLKSFGALSFDLNGTTVRLDNDRYYVGENYGGRNGAETAVICALVRDADGTEYVRQFQVTVIG